MTRRLIVKIYLCLLISFISGSVLSSSPLFSFTPLTATSLQLLASDTATVQYLVVNNSHKTHTLIMDPIVGVTQLINGTCPNPFTLTYQQSCTLSLQITGTEISNGIFGGPRICQQGPDGTPSPLLCYQPSQVDSLAIQIIPVAQYTINVSSGPNGSITPGSQRVYRDTSIDFIATAQTGYIVDKWLVDGLVSQTGGIHFRLSQITADHSVRVTFTSHNMLYGGLQNGQLYYSLNDGMVWAATPQMPANGSAINSVFATVDTLYTANADGFIHYSSNNGSSWDITTAPDGSSVNSVFAYNDTLYASTSNGFVYHSLDNGANWVSTTAPDGSAINGIFVDLNSLYAATEMGNVYHSGNNGATWFAINGMPDSSALKSVYVSNNTIYAGSAIEYAYSSTFLTGGGSWTPFAQTVYSLFVNPRDNLIYSGTQGGYVYSISNSSSLGFITYSPVNSVFVLN